MIRRLGRWLLVVGFLVATMLTLWQIGDSQLAGPPLSLDGSLDWVRDRDPVVTTFAFIRLFTLALGCYLLVVAFLGGWVHVRNTRRAHALLDRMTLGFARTVFGTVGLGAIAVASAPPAPAQVPSTSAAIIREIGVAPETEGSQATITPLPDTPSTPVPAAAEQYQVGPGDSLWSIAAARLQEFSGRDDVTDDEIAGYWHAVVDANPLPNPDLLFVGQVIDLPAVTAP